ncbi:LysR family transcriptional regulator [Candidatus Nitrotoga sp. M5]|uniref:LysR family transcriptional regulator n=1 Tax=Candidatus Nitrotoga sp. M5 TaxID=2890409 RepID=UPI001EF48F5D|nr:LysR family transcriptional regulator [Candidatus Nitrotoga sp. M5]
MDIDQIRTFLGVVAHNSFVEAANRLHVTQSTVSARIQRLETYLGVTLFVRDRSGAKLTLSGQHFFRHAKSFLLTLEQARHDIKLPSRFRASITVGARIALWEELLPRWVGTLRSQSPDIYIRSEIGFEDDLIRGMIEGRLDVSLMYTPQQSSGLQIEHLFDETLVLVTTDPDKPWPNEDYIYVDWGPAFYELHNSYYPNMERPPQVVNIGWLGAQLIISNGGSCFLPIRLAKPLIQTKQLFIVPDSKQFQLPAYMVFPRHSDSIVLQEVLESLRSLAVSERRKIKN